jgi:serine/threonine protein kinase
MNRWDLPDVPADDLLAQQLKDAVWSAASNGLAVDLSALVPAGRPDLLPFLQRVMRRAKMCRRKPSHVTQFQLGDRLRGFVVERRLGTGGMGEVYLVRRESDGQRFALKRTRTGAGVHLGGIELALTREQQFFQELLTWIGLPRHPNLVACCFFRSLGMELAIFSEYVPGGSLWEAVVDRGFSKPMSPTAFTDLALQTLAGRECLHTHGVTHQDIKPQNILMGGNGRPVYKINDFGIARGRKHSGQHAASDGQPEAVPVSGYDPVFCSPEQRQSHVVLPATDIWSWALTMLYAVAGRVTWKPGELASLATFTAWPGDVGDQLAGILKKCLCKEPGLRPQVAWLREQLLALHRQVSGQEFLDVPLQPLPELVGSPCEFYVNDHMLEPLYEFSGAADSESLLQMQQFARSMQAGDYDRAGDNLRHAYQSLDQRRVESLQRPWMIRLSAALVYLAQVYDKSGRSADAAAHLELGINVLERLAIPRDFDRHDLLAESPLPTCTAPGESLASEVGVHPQLQHIHRSRSLHILELLHDDSPSWDESPLHLQRVLRGLRSMLTEIRQVVSADSAKPASER